MIKSTTVQIKLDKINIPAKFKATIPAAEKIAARLACYQKAGAFDREIILDENYNLIDGYSTYLVCKMLGLTKVRALRIKVNYTELQLLDMLSKQIRERC